MERSLNHIVEDLAFKLGDQFNYPLRESLKYTVCIYREKLLREEDFNSGINFMDFRQKAIIPLEDWDNEGFCYEGRITTVKIPKSIRFKNRGRNRFNFVGDKSGTLPFTQTTFVEYEYVKNLKHQTDKYFYVLEDDKLIVLNTHKLCNVRIDGIFTDPRALQSICDNVEEVDDDAPFPISGDLLAIIISGVLNGTFPIRQTGEKDIITSNPERQQQ